MVLAVLKLFSIVELTGEKCKGNRACVHCVQGEQLALLVPSFLLFVCLVVYVLNLVLVATC